MSDEYRYEVMERGPGWDGKERLHFRRWLILPEYPPPPSWNEVEIDRLTVTSAIGDIGEPPHHRELRRMTLEPWPWDDRPRYVYMLPDDAGRGRAE